MAGPNPARTAAPPAARAGPGPFGAFGKIPALGDFFRTGLPQPFVEVWDGWLQQVLTQGRGLLGPLWTGRYMTAPIWRFALAPGLAGPQAVLGVLMPSVDRVGRQFPLTLAAPTAAEMPLRLLLTHEAALTQLELIALDSLEDSMTRPRLEARLAALAPAPPPPPARRRDLDGGFALRGRDTGSLLADLAAPPPSSSPVSSPARAVFLAALDGEARLLCLPALPQGAAAGVLFDLDSPFWAEDSA